MPETTGQKQDEKRNPDGTWKSGVSGNPEGRPKGASSFRTKFFEAIEKMGEQKEESPEEIEKKLLLVGVEKALDGDYRFWHDLFNRLYGKPVKQTKLSIQEKQTEEVELTEEEKESINRAIELALPREERESKSQQNTSSNCNQKNKHEK